MMSEHCWTDLSILTNHSRSAAAANFRPSLSSL